MGKVVKSYKELDVYSNAMNAAMEIFEITRTFPCEEKYSLVDQVRRSSRSVCANLAEAWHKRRYKKEFILKLSFAESEAAETQVWIEFATKCGYISLETCERITNSYSKIISQLIKMSHRSDSWIIRENDEP